MIVNSLDEVHPIETYSDIRDFALYNLLGRVLSLGLKLITRTFLGIIKGVYQFAVDIDVDSA